jgi:homoserine trans-succinylase
VYANLAYGAQAIQYFTYSPPHGSDYTDTPVDEYGKPTKYYYQLKEVNEEIKNLSFVFANSTVEWTKHYNYPVNDRMLNIPDRECITSKEPVTFPPQLKLLGTSGPVIISLLEKNENKYLIIVNRSFFDDNTASLEFDPSVKRILKTGVATDAESKIIIKPGDAIIYTWKK